MPVVESYARADNMPQPVDAEQLVIHVENPVELCAKIYPVFVYLAQYIVPAKFILGIKCLSCRDIRRRM